MPAPYSGNPANYPPSVEILSGSDVPNTTTFNTTFEGTLDRTAWLATRVPSPAQNWYSQFTGASLQFQCASPLPYVATGTVAATQIPNAAAWLYVVQDSSKLKAIIASGLDAAAGATLGTFFGPDGNTCYNVACCVDSSGTPWVVALGTVSATLTLYVIGFNGLSWQVVETTTSFTGSPSGLEMATLGAYVIFILGSAVEDDAYVESSNTDWNTSPSKTTLLGMRFFAPLLKSNGSLAIIVPAQEPMGASPTYYTSTDGYTWTQRTPGFFGATDRIEGLTWYTPGQVWILAVQTAWGTIPATTAFYSSPDGVTWTKIANGPSGIYIADMETIGNALVCTIQDGNAADGGSGSAGSGQIFSDDGGMTWRLSQAGLANNAAQSVRGYSRPRLVAGPSGLFAFNTLYARWSFVCGLPTHL